MQEKARRQTKGHYKMKEKVGVRMTAVCQKQGTVWTAWSGKDRSHELQEESTAVTICRPGCELFTMETFSLRVKKSNQNKTADSQSK
jgi:hypothetical protein